MEHTLIHVLFGFDGDSRLSVVLAVSDF